MHHGDGLQRALFKQPVGLYHDAVRQRVRAALRISGRLRRQGLVVREKAFANPAERPALLARLPASRTLAADLRWLWKSDEVLAAVEDKMRRRLVQRAQRVEVVRRWVALPGIAWVRAATLYVWLDTPWRFRSKSAWWKYLGIGLERRRRGNGPERVGVPPRVNRALKSTLLGAAQSAVAQGDNPLADQYRRWIEAGRSPKLARQRGAEPGGDRLGPVEKRQRVPPRMGGRGRGRWPGGRGVCVSGGLRFRRGGGVPSESIDPSRGGVPCPE